MRNKPFLLVGIILVVIGAAAILHPQYSYRVSQHAERIGPSQIEYETRRVYHLPIWFGIAITTIGAALVVGGLQKE